MQTNYILLSSATNDQAATRSFNEFKTSDDLAKTIIKHFEDYLQATSGQEDDQFEYSSDDLFDFVDKFYGELVCLERQQDNKELWTPYSTCWVKEAIYLHLKTMSEQQQPADEANAMDVDTNSTDHVLINCS